VRHIDEEYIAAGSFSAIRGLLDIRTPVHQAAPTNVTFS
jgi:hypothetical protein